MEAGVGVVVGEERIMRRRTMFGGLLFAGCHRPLKVRAHEIS
jgi:hypothetical protein